MSEAVRIFVYGTLKRGYRNHERFCVGFCALEAGRVAGRLWLHSHGYPMLEIESAGSVVRGTGDRAADCRAVMAAEPGAVAAGALEVAGELLTWSAGGAEVLRAMDELEWFWPEQGALGTSEYWRVMVPVVTAGGAVCVAWTYVMPPGVRPDRLRRLASGVWAGDRGTASDRPGSN